VTAAVYKPLPESQPDDRYRHRIGILLGAALGLTYGLVTQVGNRLVAQPVPLYQPPWGMFGNVILYATAGALLGLLVAIPRSGLKGVFLMAAAGAGGIILLSLLTSASLSENFALGVVAALSLALPFWGLFVPIFAALRWVINHQEESRRDRRPWRGRLLGPLALIAIVAWVASFSLYPPAGRETLQVANAFLSGAAKAGSVPAALSAVPEFAAHATSPYQLAWEREDLSKYRIPRPTRAFDRHSAIIARYPDGWSLVCVYITLDEPPVCRGFTALPR
jgi:hypothetical protein